MKKVKFVFVGATVFLLILTAILPVNAQFFKKESETMPLYPAAGGVTWMKSFGNPDWSTAAYYVQQTNDGGYIVVGYVYGDTHAGVWLVKIDENGNMEWEKTYDLSDKYETGRFVQQTSDGGYIILGSTGSRYDARRILLFKTDNDGNKLWDKILEGEYNTSASSLQIFDDGFIIAGSIEYSENYSDGLLIKTDSYGNVEWEKIFDKSDEDDFVSMDLMLDGGFIITGGTGDHLWLLKTDSNGNQLWDKTWKYPDSESTYGASVQQTNDGGFIVLGDTWAEYDPDTFPPDCDAWLIKTDSNGNKVWEKTYGGKGMDLGVTVRQTTDDGYIFTGFKHKLLGEIPSPDFDLWLLKTNANGKKIWERIYGGFFMHIEMGTCVQQTSDGGYIISGIKAEGPVIVYHDWVIKTDESGKVKSKSRARTLDSIFFDLLNRFPRLSRLFLQLPVFTKLRNLQYEFLANHFPLFSP